MALLVEGLNVGGETSIKEYIIGPDNDIVVNQEHATDKDRIKLYGAEGKSWIARPVSGHSTLSIQSTSLMDPLVTLFGSIHEKLLPASGSMRSILFSNFGSMLNAAEQHSKHEQWDEESLGRNDDDHSSNGSGDESDDNLRSPLLSRQGTNADNENGNEHASSMGIGGGWQLAYRKDEEGSGGVKRIYLHQEGDPGSRNVSVLPLSGGIIPAQGEFIHAAALVSQSVLHPDDITSQHQIGEAMDKQIESAAKGSSWMELFEPGVKHALLVGIGIQILQQVKLW